MKRIAAVAVWAACLLVVVPGAIAQGDTNAYAKMAPLDQYLIADQAAEIALARSGAPASIGNDAEVMVLDRSGFKTAVEGKNGFVCVVERGWGAGTTPSGRCSTRPGSATTCSPANSPGRFRARRRAIFRRTWACHCCCRATHFADGRRR